MRRTEIQWRTWHEGLFSDGVHWQRVLPNKSRKHKFVRTLFGSLVRFFFTRTEQQSHAGSSSTCIFLYDIWNNMCVCVYIHTCCGREGYTSVIKYDYFLGVGLGSKVFYLLHNICLRFLSCREEASVILVIKY